MTAKGAAPKIDFEAWFQLQRANLETWLQAQKLVFDYSTTLGRKQLELVKELFGRAEGLVKGVDAKKQPQELVEEAKAAVDKAFQDLKEAVDLGLKTQSQVLELWFKRATANFEEVRKLAA